ncbi:hypothetical protein ACLHDG_09555 [Sulfurovum sp. CS9]|uniref:hypothetical protein n=1 Tax=Sulfurovum sp. CS9 TaxID=3391146 RepID=UPI0039EBE2AE
MTEEPSEIISKYYHALYNGDLSAVKDLMTEKSYIMTLESFGLRLSFRDGEFKSLLKEIEDSPESLEKVEALLSQEIISRNKAPKIKISKCEPNGSERETVYYTEDGKVKKLYFSKENGGWKINYYAGRPLPQSYFSIIKNWTISILPSFK